MARSNKGQLDTFKRIKRVGKPTTQRARLSDVDDNNLSKAHLIQRSHSNKIDLALFD